MGKKIYFAVNTPDPSEFHIASAVAPLTTAGNATVISAEANDGLEFFEVVEIGAVGSPDTYIYWSDNSGTERIVRKRIFPTLGSREVLYEEGVDVLIVNGTMRSVAVDVANDAVYIGLETDILVGTLDGLTALTNFSTNPNDLDDLALELTVPNHTPPTYTASSATTTTSMNIQLTFSEPVEVNMSDGSDFTVAGATVTAAAVDGGDNTLVNLTIDPVAADFTSSDLDIAFGAVND